MLGFLLKKEQKLMHKLHHQNHFSGKLAICYMEKQANF